MLEALRPIGRGGNLEHKWESVCNEWSHEQISRLPWDGLGQPACEADFVKPCYLLTYYGKYIIPFPGKVGFCLKEHHSPLLSTLMIVMNSQKSCHKVNKRLVNKVKLMAVDRVQLSLCVQKCPGSRDFYGPTASDTATYVTESIMTILRICVVRLFLAWYGHLGKFSYL